MTNMAGETSGVRSLALKGTAHAVLPAMSLSFARGLTVQAWVYLDDRARSATILALGERADSRAIEVTVAAGSGDLVVAVTDRPGGRRTLVAPAAVAVGKWTHVTVTMHERGTSRIVVDGQEKTSAAKFMVPASGGRRLGFIGRSLADAGETLRGSVAEVRLWSRDLSIDEIAETRDRRLTGDEPELAGYWPLDALADGRLPDRSGRGRSARPVDAALTVRAGLSLAPPRAATPALTLRGGATIAARNDASRVAASGLTFQAWVRLHRHAGEACVFELGDVAGAWSLALTTDAGGGLAAVVRERGVPVGTTAGRVPVAVDTWTHVTVSLGRALVVLSIGGVRVAASPLLWRTPVTASGYAWQTLTVGKGRGAGAVDADFAEVRLFTTVLSPRQVGRSVRRTMLGSEAELAIQWRLDEGRGATARNSGLLGNDPAVREAAACDGTIVGGEWIADGGLTRARPVDVRTTRALRLDGVGGSATLPGLRRGFGEGYTIEAWVRHDSFGGAPIVDMADWRGAKGSASDLAEASGSAFDRISLGNVGSAPDLQFAATRGRGGLKTVTAEGVLAPGRWTHVAATVAPSGLVSLFVDARRVAEKVCFTPAEVAADEEVARGIVVLGRHASTQTKHLDGALAEVRIWGRALTTSELRARRYLRASGSEHALVACYPLDEAEGEAIVDRAASERRGRISAGADRQESPELPLWPADERAGAGVDAVCRLMQDTRVVTVKGQRTSREVAVYEVSLAARTAGGAPAGRTVLEVVADEPVAVRHDRGVGAVFMVAPGLPARVPTNNRGQARLTIDANGFTSDDREVLRCPILKVRTAAMPEGQWEVITPDTQAHEALTAVTGDQLRAGRRPTLGRRSTRPLLGPAVTAADADELATTVRTLMGIASRGVVAAEDASPLAFAVGEAGPTATDAAFVSPSAGAAARVDGEAPLRRPIPAIEAPLPEGELVSFAAGEPGEPRVTVELLAAPAFAVAGGMVSFAPESSRLGPGREQLAEIERIRAAHEAALAAAKDEPTLGEKIRARFKAFGQWLERLFKEAIVRPIKDLIGSLETAYDAFIIRVEEADGATGVLRATFQLVVDVGGKVVRAVIDSVESALGMMGGFLAKLGAKLGELVDFLAAVFDWGDILETAEELHRQQLAALLGWQQSLRGVLGRWKQTMGRIEGKVTASLDRAISRLGVADPPAPAEPDDRTAHIFSKVENCELGAGLSAELASFDATILKKIAADFDVGRIGEQFKATLRSFDLEQMFGSVDGFFRGGASAVLVAVKALVQLVLETVEVFGALALEFAVQLFELVKSVATRRLYVPGLTDFIEVVILGGKELTLLRLLSVVTAVPYTVFYKLAHGTDEGPFAAKQGMVDFAGEAPAQDSAMLQVLQAQDEAAALVLARKHRLTDAAAFTNVSCTFISGWITAGVDAVDDKSAMARGIKLGNTICGAVSCGVSGFPPGVSEEGKESEIGLWCLGIVASAVSLADASACVATKGDEAVAFVFACVGAATSLLQFTWTLAAAARETAVTDKTREQDRLTWLAASSNMLGCVPGMLTPIPNDNEVVLLVKTVANSACLAGQLGTGLAAAYGNIRARKNEAALAELNEQLAAKP